LRGSLNGEGLEVTDDPLAAARDEHARYVTITFFVRQMMGKKSKTWYYNHVDDPGFPQRIYLPGAHRPVLSYDECLAFQKRGTKTPPWKPRRR